MCVLVQHKEIEVTIFDGRVVDEGVMRFEEFFSEWQSNSLNKMI